MGYFPCNEYTTHVQPIGEWITSNGNSMDYMLHGATRFNQSPSVWDTSSVKSMDSIFERPPRFNQPLAEWDTSSVKSMDYYNMFVEPPVSTNPSPYGTPFKVRSKHEPYGLRSRQLQPTLLGLLLGYHPSQNHGFYVCRCHRFQPSHTS